MKPLGLNKIREKFLSFFEAKEHLRLLSAPLLPKNDASLLLINSGMAPLKPYFTGREKPPKKRVTTCQKCIRTIDIDRVGLTARHGTFFEMLGNFSFGDYFKQEAIPWAWEFMTKVMEIPEELLSVSVYEQDDEAYAIWRDKVGVPENKIIRLGKDDNFWEVGTGPCGPCSEIYFDRGANTGCGKPDCAPGCDCDRFTEIWNLVFTQFDRTDEGEYEKLANPNIDTGMGLERIAAVMQGVPSLFDVDTVKKIRDKACSLTNTEYGHNTEADIHLRIITDHIRSVMFLTSDGVLPSNEGAGYISRRLLRRAAMRGRLLGVNKPFLTELAETVIEVSKDAYPELEQKRDYITKIIYNEETRFNQTISQGMELLKSNISELKKTGNKVLSGAAAFNMYDTFGFPLELTKEMLAAQGLGVDEEGFKQSMDIQKKRARGARGETDYSGGAGSVYDSVKTDETVFTGYNIYSVTDAKVLAIVKGDTPSDTAACGESVSIILDKTPFYAESGGQKGDCGLLKTAACEITVDNCVKVSGGRYAHIGHVTKGEIKKGDMLTAAIDTETRAATARNHTATHLLQKALCDVLGAHVEQAGSAVSADRLRFDFTHFSPLTAEETEKTEAIVNEQIMAALDIDINEMPLDEARKLGAVALFGEKYGDTVRVVKMGEFSVELCGGTHLKNTSGAGLFVILSETGISAGVRRIEALTGKNALNYYKKQEQTLKHAALLLKTSPAAIADKIENLTAQLKTQAAELEKQKAAKAGGMVNEIIEKAVDINGLSAAAFYAGDMDMNTLRAASDKVRAKFDGVLILASSYEGKANFLATAPEGAVKKGAHCGEIVKKAAITTGGGGGGKPGSAQAGGKDASKIEEALKNALEMLKQQIS